MRQLLEIGMERNVKKVMLDTLTGIHTMHTFCFILPIV